MTRIPPGAGRTARIKRRQRILEQAQGAAHNGPEPPFKTLAKPPVGHAPTNRAGGRPRAAFDVEMAVALYKKGMGVERIAARLSTGGRFVSPTTVWRRLRELADRDGPGRDVAG